MQQVNNANKSSGFKSATNSQSSFAQSSGTNLGAQALIQRRKKLKTSLLRQRRASSYSTSSEEEAKEGMKLAQSLDKSFKPGQWPAIPVTGNPVQLSLSAASKGEEIKE